MDTVISDLKLCLHVDGRPKRRGKYLFIIIYLCKQGPNFSSLSSVLAQMSGREAVEARLNTIEFSQQEHMMVRL